jgi:IclR family KDG regulon transcriptional repressor
MGKIMLAYLPEEKVKEILSGNKLRRFTNDTITDIKKLNAEIEEVRRNGYSRDNGEYMENICCIGFPIFNADQQLAAAFSLSGPLKIIKQSETNIIPDGLQSSKSCSLQLGFSLSS